MRRVDATATVTASANDLAEYDIVLLAGSPKRHTLRLAVGIEEGAVIEVEGERWTVADVRSEDGSRVRLICIYAI